MIKKITVDQLRPGMYVHELDCSWTEHPFLRNRFKLSSAEDLGKIRKLNIRALYIDTARGLDVAEAPSLQEIRQQTSVQLSAVATQPSPPPPVQVSLREERARATQVRSEAEQVIAGLMRDVRLGRQVELEPVEHAVEPLVASIVRNKDALLGLTRIRHMDRYTFEHSVSVAVLMVSFARQMELDLPTIGKIGTGALLHDIGETLTPPPILNKPGALTAAELEVMRRHAVHSREILEHSPGIHPVSLAVAAEHHERYDGSGYPRGLQGQDISLYGQMASIADVYDAITANRVYRAGVEPHEVLRKLIEWSKLHFDPVLVQRFIQCVGIYPVGTLVSLASGRIGVVLASGSKGLLHPLVRLVYDSRNGKAIPPQDLDLSSLPPGSDERIVGSEPAGVWGIDPGAFMQA